MQDYNRPGIGAVQVKHLRVFRIGKLATPRRIRAFATSIRTSVQTGPPRAIRCLAGQPRPSFFDEFDQNVTIVDRDYAAMAAE